MDRFTKEKRSDIMSRVKSKNTRLELLIFDILRKKGIEFETHYDVSGKPDLVFPGKKIAVFIDGDFWHGWRFEDYKNKLTDYWYQKISLNIRRDKRNRSKLKVEGWKIMRFWEHRVQKNPYGCVKSLLRELDKIK